MRRALLAGAIMVLAAPVLLVGWWRISYRWELQRIERGLNEIRGIRVVKIWGNEDITLEDIGAEIEVVGKGSLTFFNLEAASLSGARHLQLAQVRPWSYLGCERDL